MRAIIKLLTSIFIALPTAAYAQLSFEPLPPAPSFEPLQDGSVVESAAPKRLESPVSSRVPEKKVGVRPPPSAGFKPQLVPVLQHAPKRVMPVPVVPKPPVSAIPVPRPVPSQSFVSPRPGPSKSDVEVEERTIYSRRGDQEQVAVIRSYRVNGRVVHIDGLVVTERSDRENARRSPRKEAKSKQGFTPFEGGQAGAQHNEGPLY